MTNCKNSMSREKFLKKISEKEHQKVCLEIFKQLGWTVWRTNSGMGKYQNEDGSFRAVHYGHPGLPDICGYTPKGQAVFWEVKKKGGKLSPEQKNFIANAQIAGCWVGHGTSDDLKARIIKEKYTKILDLY